MIIHFLNRKISKIPNRCESFKKELEYVKQMWKNRQELKVEDAGIAALFGLECFAWFCAGEIVGRGFTFTGDYMKVLKQEIDSTTIGMQSKRQSLEPKIILDRIRSMAALLFLESHEFSGYNIIVWQLWMNMLGCLNRESITPLKVFIGNILIRPFLNLHFYIQFFSIREHMLSAIIMTPGHIVSLPE
ncbi:hypothetical protein F8388_001955 [Cannabis sativa]|uniref:Uncharacterized protein n=1 Tax=Cannabis sativa TaxID=3483 RepID=A0A7J6FLB3_CANSA|nr:hypothetical protein F8388_001955 [Cannabis sativa]